MLRCATLVGLIVVVFGGRASAQLFEISKPVFSAFVSPDNNYTPVGAAKDGRISKATLGQGLLYFSFTLVGGQAAIDYLKQHRELQAAVVILDDQSETISGLGISQEKWTQGKDAWLTQFEQQGYFTFRTFMNTQKISRDVIVLQVRDTNNYVVRPVGYTGATYRASVFITP